MVLYAWKYMNKTCHRILNLSTKLNEVSIQISMGNNLEQRKLQTQKSGSLRPGRFCNWVIMCAL